MIRVRTQLNCEINLVRHQRLGYGDNFSDIGHYRRYPLIDDRHSLAYLIYDPTTLQLLRQTYLSNNKYLSSFASLMT